MDKILEFLKGIDFKSILEKLGAIIDKFFGIDLL